MSNIENKTAALVTQDKVNLFIDAYQRGMKAWEDAGKIIVEIVDQHPEGVDMIYRLCPTFTPTLIGMFERIGRGLLLPALAMDGSAGSRKLRDLPLSMQKKYYEEAIPVIINTPSGTDTIMIEAKNMTKDQAAQVFAKGRIRTEGEQRAYLAEQNSKQNAATAKEAPPVWKIKNGRVVFEQGATLSAGELAMIISQITK